MRWPVAPSRIKYKIGLRLYSNLNSFGTSSTSEDIIIAKEDIFISKPPNRESRFELNLEHNFFLSVYHELWLFVSVIDVIFISFVSGTKLLPFYFGSIKTSTSRHLQ